MSTGLIKECLHCAIQALSPREAWQCAYIEQNTIGDREDGVCVLVGKTDSIAAEGQHRDMSLIGTGDLGLL